MSFGLYIIGFIVLIVGLAIGANMLRIPQQWIGVGIVCNGRPWHFIRRYDDAPARPIGLIGLRPY